MSSSIEISRKRKRDQNLKYTPLMQNVIKSYQLVQARLCASTIPSSAFSRLMSSKTSKTTISNESNSNTSTTTSSIAPKTNINSLQQSKNLNENLPDQTELFNIPSKTNKKFKHSSI